MTTQPGLRIKWIAGVMLLVPGLVIWMLGMTAGAVGAAPIANSGHAGDATCFTEINGDNVTDFSSGSSTALQDAVDAISPGGTVKVAGICSGVQATSGFTQTVYISKTIIVQGGYTNTNWLASSDPDTYPTILDAQGQGRVVFLPYNITVQDVVLDGLHMTNGDAYNVNAGKCGDFGNSGGGAVCLGSARRFTITNSLIDNSVALNGGGIYRHGGGFALSIVNTTVKSNTAHESGGGVFQAYDTLSIENSTFHNNVATSHGGAIFLGLHQLYINNSTISGNMTLSNGGALAVRFGSDNLWIDNSTIISNTANGNGGGIYNFTGQPITLTQSIVALNMDNDSSSPDCSGPIGTGGYNLVGILTGCTLTPTVTDTTGQNPQLEALAQNGGDTRTHAPQGGSPVINAIPGASCVNLQDQRGLPRPANTDCDIGAVEVDYDTYTATLAITGAGAAAWLSWNTDPIPCDYELHRSESPYSGYASIFNSLYDVTYEDEAALGNPSLNYYYYLESTCLAGNGTSNTVGEFDFTVIPGD